MSLRGVGKSGRAYVEVLGALDTGSGTIQREERQADESPHTLQDRRAFGPCLAFNAIAEG